MSTIVVDVVAFATGVTATVALQNLSEDLHAKELPTTAVNSSKAGNTPIAETYTLEELRQAVDEVYSAEPIDPKAREAFLNSDLDRLSALLVPGGRTSRVECRATWCRVEFAHPSEGGFAQFSRKLSDFRIEAGSSSARGPMLSSILSTDPAGAVASVLYVGRNAEMSLPTPRQQ